MIWVDVRWLSCGGSSYLLAQGINNEVDALTYCIPTRKKTAAGYRVQRRSIFPMNLHRSHGHAESWPARQPTNHEMEPRPGSAIGTGELDIVFRSFGLQFQLEDLGGVRRIAGNADGNIRRLQQSAK